MESTTLNAPDISCGHCVATVEDTVGNIEGVRSVSADADTRDINVTFDESRTDISKIKEVLEEAGYPAT